MNRLLRCDCVEGMRELADDFIPLTVTSPPYDKVRTYDPLPLTKFQTVARELLRITKPGGVVVWVVQEQIRNGSHTGTSSEQRLYFRDIGFHLWDRLVMARYGRRSSTALRYKLPIEEAFVLSKGKPGNVTLWADRRNRTPGRVHRFRNRNPDGTFERPEQRVTHNPFGTRPSVWRYAVGIHMAEEPWIRQAAHGAIMPEKMAEDLILSYSRADDLVFDPFCGLATTCKMALLNHRQYLGMDISEKFHELAVRRMQLAHLGYERRLASKLGG